LLWLAWLDMDDVDLMLGCPLHESAANQFWAVVCSNNAGFTAPRNDLI
jgi:hypothetical protein